MRQRHINRQVTLAIADGVMMVDGEIAYKAESLRVALFADGVAGN